MDRETASEIGEALQRYANEWTAAEIRRRTFFIGRAEHLSMSAQMFTTKERDDFLGIPGAPIWTIAELQALELSKRETGVLYWLIQYTNPGIDCGLSRDEITECMGAVDVGRNPLLVLQAVKQLIGAGLVTERGGGCQADIREIKAGLEADAATPTGGRDNE